MHQTIRRSAVEKAVKWLMKNNDLFKSVLFDENWHKPDENGKNGCSPDVFESLLSENVNEEPSVTKHDSVDEVEKEDEGDIVEGGPVLYDSTIVDNVPVLPTRDDGSSISLAPGEGKTPISHKTKNVDQLAFPGIFSQGE